MLTLIHTYMNERVTSWERCVNICTDGAMSMKEKERIMLLRMSKSVRYCTTVVTIPSFIVAL